MHQVTTIADYKKAQVLLKKNLLKNKYNRVIMQIGHQGGSSLSEMVVYYFRDYEFWWAPKLLESTPGNTIKTPRYWNAFGLGSPSDATSRSIVVEINYPLSGKTRRIAGVVLKKDSEYFLYHTGKIGGGRKGVGKTGFFDFYTGSIEEIEVDDVLEELVPFGSLYDPNLVDSLAHFVKEVNQIKDRCVLDENTEDLDVRRGHEFLPEFFGMKSFQKKIRTKGKYTSNHGRVVTQLHKQLKELGVRAANTRLIDLYTYEGAKIKMLFEVKSTLSKQSIYTAVGQLMLHSLGRKHKPKMVFVIPDKLPTQLASKLKKLGILTLRFSLQGKKINFYRLNELLKHA